jgi:hypothetical protein
MHRQTGRVGSSEWNGRAESTVWTEARAAVIRTGLAVVATVLTMHAAQAAPFEGPAAASPFDAGQAVRSILALPAKASHDEFGWSTESEGYAPATPQASPAGDGFVVTDGCTGAGGCQGCGGAGCEGCCPPAGVLNRIAGPACPRWVVQVDALMLWQNNIGSRPLFAEYDLETDTIGDTLLNANQAQTEVAAGPRVGVFCNLDSTFAIEGNYFQVRPFNGEALVQPGYTLAERNLAGFNDEGFDGAQVLTSGAIQSAELNWRRRECWCPVTWLAGFRWVQWEQQMTIIEHLDGSPYGRYASATGNDLYGGQVGMDLGLWNSGGPFTVNGVGKAGVFFNTAYQRMSYEDPELESSASAIADQTAFFGEIGINGSLRITDWLSWRVGYVLFWLSGVAVPADQLSVTNLNPADPPVGAQINTNGSVLLQGVTTGLEARW